MISGRRPGLFRLGGKCRIEAEAARGVHAVDSDGGQHLAALQHLDDARDSFEAQVGDVGDILPAGQHDAAGAIGKEADQAQDAVRRLAAA